MTIYYAILFIHVVSAMGLFITLAAEGAIFFRIRAAESIDETQFFVRAFQRLRIVAIPCFLGVLVGGLYLASKWGRGTYWIPFALGATLLILLIGGLVTGIRMARLRNLLSSEVIDLPIEAIAAKTKENALLISYGLRAGLGLGIVFLMTAKPDLPGSLGALAAGCGAGLLGAAWMGRASNRVGTIPCLSSPTRRIDAGQKARWEQAQS
jgi:hypothetical protein